MLFLLLRPVCDVLAAEFAHAAQAGAAHGILDGQHDSGRDAPCCADIEDGALAKVSEKAGMQGGPEATVATPVLLSVLHSGAPATGARDRSVVPRTPASFYVRSARVRR